MPCKNCSKHTNIKPLRTNILKIQNNKIEVIFKGEEKAYSEDGVDLTLIRWMLSLSPAERLKNLQANIRSIMRLQDEIKRK